MTIISDSISITLASASFWETVEYSAMGAVLIGVIGEIVADFSCVSQSEYWKQRVGKWSAILLAVALAFELLATVKTNKINDTIIAEVQLDAVKLGVSFGNLGQFVKDKTEEFNDATDELKLETKDLNSARDAAIKAEQSAKKVLADVNATLDEVRTIQQQIMLANKPRELSLSQKKKFVERLSKFDGILVNVWRGSTTPPDTMPLAEDILSLLNKADLKANGIFISNTTYGTGVIIAKRKNSSPKITEAVNALVDELRSDNITTGYEPDFTDGAKFEGGYG